MTISKDFGPHGWTPDQLGSLSGKTYVISGGNAGAGFEASRILLSKGAKVVMLNRSPERSSAAVATLKQEYGEQAYVSFIAMDLAVLGRFNSRDRTQPIWSYPDRRRNRHYRRSRISPNRLKNTARASASGATL